MELTNANLDYLGHSGFLITHQDKKIAIDPYNLSDKTPEVDIILITHSHYDHCSIKDIERLAKEGTRIVIPADAQSKITKIQNIDMQILEPGEEITFGKIKVEAVPAYNTNKFRNPGEVYHPKQEGWLGYLIKFDKTIIYHTGDSDKIPEMKNLTGHAKKGNEFIALLPVSGKYVMDSEEATEVASILNPTLSIPMHYGAGVAGTQSDAETFVSECKKLGLKAQILEKI